MAKCKPRAHARRATAGDSDDDRAVAVEALLQGGGSVSSRGSSLIPGSPGDNSTLFNGMISPWVNTAVRGAIWYQVRRVIEDIALGCPSCMMLGASRIDIGGGSTGRATFGRQDTLLATS